jgi:phosphoribosylglycinamide formyltransferase-1
VADLTDPLRVGWFSTGRGPGSRALLTATVEAIHAGRLQAEISFVFCNREPGQDPNTDLFLDLAQRYGLPVLTLSDRAYRRQVGGEVARAGRPLPPWRARYDREMLEMIAPHPFDVGMLAGYMLIFTPETTAAHPFLNLHPAAPGGPKGIWQEVIWQLITEGARESGVYMHVTTPELDEGPVATFCRYPIRGALFDPLWNDVSTRGVDTIREQEGEYNRLFGAIRRHGAARELPLVIATLTALATRRLRITPGRVTDTGGNDVPALDLSDAVDAAVREELEADVR